MIVKFQGISVELISENIGSLIDLLKKDNNFQSIFDDNDEIKWNIVFILNGNVLLEKVCLFDIKLNPNDTLFILVQLAGG